MYNIIPFQAKFIKKIYVFYHTSNLHPDTDRDQPNPPKLGLPLHFRGFASFFACQGRRRTFLYHTPQG